MISSCIVGRGVLLLRKCGDRHASCMPRRVRASCDVWIASTFVIASAHDVFRLHRAPLEWWIVEASHRWRTPHAVCPEMHNKFQ